MRTILSLFALLSFFYAEASHIVGGAIHYECLGNNLYEITLYVYRDCNPGNSGYDPNPVVGVYENSTLVTSLQLALSEATVTTLPLDTGDPCLIPPDNVCVQEAIYTGQLTIPPSAIGYTLAYQRCCRNTTILNVPAGGDNLGSTFFTEIPPSSAAACNTNPLFNNLPPVLLCANEPFVFDYSATDADGDSLVYIFCNPKDGGIPGVQMNPPTAPPYLDVPWNATFSVDYPITSTPAFSVDIDSGLMTGTPTQVGQFVVGVCVEEYRNGQLLSTTNRDFQFNVVLCGQATIANLDELPQCEGLAYTFENQSSGATTFEWDFGTPAGDGSAEQSPSFTYPDAGVYTVTLIANPGGTCADTAEVAVYAFWPLSAEFTLEGGECVPGGRLFEVAPDSAYSSAVSFNWNFGIGSVPETSFEAGEDSFIAGVAGTNTATLTLQFGPCEASYSADFIVDPFPIAEVAPQTSFCEGLSFTFENNSQFATTYSWFFGHAGNNNSAVFEPEHTFPSTGNYLVQLIADPGSACADTAFAEIIILPEDPIVLEYTLAVPGPCDTSNVVQFTFTGEGADDILWQAGDGTEYGTETAVHVYGEPGTYTVQLEAYNGLCDVTESTSVEIDVFPGPLPYPVAIPNVFTPNGDAINDTFHLFFELAPGVPVELPGNKSIYDYLEDYQLQIYNRWGALLFDSSNGIMEWSGDDHADGTYYALIRFQRRCLDDTAKEIGRHFTLLR